MANSATITPAAVTPRPSSPGLTLAILVTCQFMIALDATVVNIALPQIQADLNFTHTSLAWVTSTYTLTFGGLLLLGGRSGDILGRRRLFMAGILVFTAASLVGGLATTAAWLIAARALQGVGAAFAAPGTLSLIATNFAEGPQRNRALGAVAGAYGGSLVLGVLLGGVLTELASWRWVLFINVPIGVALLLLVPRFVVDGKRYPGRFDLTGALTSTLGVGALVFGMVRAASEGWSDRTAQIAIAGAAVLLIAFVLVETRAEQPITPLKLLTDRDRLAGYLTLLLLSVPMVNILFFVSQFMQDVIGFTALRAGLAFLPMAAGIFAGGGLAAVLVQRLGAKRVALVGIVIIAGGLLWLTQLSATSHYAPSVVGPMIMFSFGSGFAFTAMNTVVLAGVPAHESGAASGVLETMQYLGGALGLSALITVFASAVRRAADDPLPDAALQTKHQLAEGMATSFGAGTLFVAAAFLIVAFMLRHRRPEPAATTAAGAPGDA